MSEGKKSKLKIWTSIIGTLSLVTFWQNCSNVNFDSVNSGLNTKANEVGAISVAGGGSQGSDNTGSTPSDNSGHSQDEDQNGVSDESELNQFCDIQGDDDSVPPAPQPAPQPAPVPSDINTKAFSLVAAGSDQILSGHRGSVSFSDVGQLEVVDQRGALRVDHARSCDIHNTRGPISVAADVVKDISDTRGPICLRLSRGARILNHRGPIRIRGVGSEPVHIELIEDVRGPIVLENVIVDRLVNHIGPVILRNSEVH